MIYTADGDINSIDTDATGNVYIGANSYNIIKINPQEQVHFKHKTVAHIKSIAVDGDYFYYGSSIRVLKSSQYYKVLK